MLIAFMMLFIQELDLATQKNWETLASPWMTRAESQIHGTLSPQEKEIFKGAFVMRRIDDPQQWRATGLYLPEFFCPTPHGDIRDQISFLLGKPTETAASDQDPKLPRMWKYDKYAFYFQSEPSSSKVKLARQSLEEWDRAISTLIKHPQHLYDFRKTSFGRTRLIQDLKWVDAPSVRYWSTPQGNGSSLRVMIPIPEEFKQYIRDSKRKPVQHMEALLLLKKEEGETFTQVQRKDRLRHGSQRLNLLEEDHISFEAHIPPGAFQVEFLLYSGYLEKGLRVTAPLTATSPELPRIGDPIISQNRQLATLLTPEDWAIHVGSYFYRATTLYQKHRDAYVLVQSDHEDTQLWLHTGASKPTALKLQEQRGKWFVFVMPPQAGPFRLTALGFHPRGNYVAVSTQGPPMGKLQSKAPVFEQDGMGNYLIWEEIKFQTSSPLTLLFVNDRALVGSKNGTFVWPSVDWGEKATLRIEYPSGNEWHDARYGVKRNQVFEELRVKPKFIVAGTRNIGGQIEDAKISVMLDGKPAQIVKQTALANQAKLWGLVVNDALLKSPTWPLVRETLTTWLKGNTGDNDLIYVVHISDRPKLIQEPTVYKAQVLAALNALIPATRNENYFTVQYLVDALTHLPEHQARPHQVLLMTNKLTGEVDQMQALIPVLRQTGLQVYNLSFPFDFQTQSEGKVANIEPDALTIMDERERQDQMERIATRDNFQEERNVTTSLGSIKFGKKKLREKAKEERLRNEAVEESFNEQLGALTAGLSHRSGPGETMISLSRFFEELTQWQHVLQHLELSEQQLNEDRLSIQAPDGYMANWTLVEWSPTGR